jgi:hypothetical protein
MLTLPSIRSAHAHRPSLGRGVEYRLALHGSLPLAGDDHRAWRDVHAERRDTALPSHNTRAKIRRRDWIAGT